MGQIALQAIESHPRLTLVATAGRGDDLTQTIQTSKPNVVLDLTLPDCVFNNAQIMIANNAHPVIGTSGLTAAQIDTLKQQCLDKNLGGLIAPNFSISALLMMQFSQQAARYFDHANIIEYHHTHKKDAPSGTALRTSEVMSSSIKDIPIQSLRMPHYLAHQEVILGNPFESLTIRQDTQDRRAFIPGIQRACMTVVDLQGLIIGLENTL